jgi:hypothetical protein
MCTGGGSSLWARVLRIDHLEHGAVHKPELAVGGSRMTRIEAGPTSARPIERVIQFKIESDGRIPRPRIDIALADVYKPTGQMKPESTILLVGHVLHDFAGQAVFRGETRPRSVSPAVESCIRAHEQRIFLDGQKAVACPRAGR